MFEINRTFHGASLFGRLLRLPLKLLPAGLTVPVLSGLNRGMKWKVGSSVHGCWLGFYEKDKQQLIARLIQPGDVPATAANADELDAWVGFKPYTPVAGVARFVAWFYEKVN